MEHKERQRHIDKWFIRFILIVMLGMPLFGLLLDYSVSPRDYMGLKIGITVGILGTIGYIIMWIKTKRYYKKYGEDN